MEETLEKKPMASPPSSPPLAKKQKMSTTASDTDPEPEIEAETETNQDPSSAPAERRRRYKRRKVAIFLGYCGYGYQGMQKNPGAKTIEGDLEEAFFHAGGVPEADRGAPRRYDWARAARTDKGVSAAAQVVSGRFYVDPPGFVDRLNGILPDQIRIYGYKRVTNAFNAKKFCDRRRYIYLLPVFALDPSAHPDREAVMASIGSGNELVKCVECSERGRKIPGLMGPDPVKLNGVASSVECEAGDSDLKSMNDDLIPEDVKQDDTLKVGEESTIIEKVESVTAMNTEKSQFSYDDAVKERFNSILKNYEGTHNFHNFTTRTKAEDPSAKRYIISFNANSVVSLDGIDFVKCEVVGQSFMLHQIRKMIGLAVAIMRNCAPESLMEVALRKDVSINVPTAPELGLFLDECLFSSYNKKWKSSHEEVSMKDYENEAEEFKMKFIYSHIASMEHKEGAVALWLHSLNRRNYPDFNYLETNSKPVGSEETKQECLETAELKEENLGQKESEDMNVGEEETKDKKLSEEESKETNLG
ncbi:tRNA pseudouridine synthase family protein [Rhynchospora pubera]|uniref:tRNA pseudouridine synthase family protein n=1 Tax=Rhynchospora pubera TaxID=906938 RepID=A0AAV8G361_9POAL|nr:tRNA pseudouridine synthase family protein [Rhynchospora pubera]KAJ4800150.1 tRNA pseudouridine synthase family protein [Rhynchospora pubera]